MSSAPVSARAAMAASTRQRSGVANAPIELDVELAPGLIDTLT